MGTGPGLLEVGDPFEDFLLRPRPEPFQFDEPVLVAGIFKFLDGGDPERVADLLDLLGTESGDGEEVRDPRGKGDFSSS